MVTYHTPGWGWLSLAPEQCPQPSPRRMCLGYTLNTTHIIKSHCFQNFIRHFNELFLLSLLICLLLKALFCHYIVNKAALALFTFTENGHSGILLIRKKVLKLKKLMKMQCLQHNVNVNMIASNCRAMVENPSYKSEE